MSKRSIVAALAIFGALGGATPAEAVLRASGELRRVSTTRYELVVRNTGDESLRSIAFIAASGVRPSTAQTSGSECTIVHKFRGGGDGFLCGNFTLDPDRSRVFGFRTPRAYPTGAGGTLLAYEPPEAGRHRSFVIGPPPPAGSRPLAGRSELFEPVGGVVLVRRRGSRRFLRLQRGQLVPDRSEIDTRRGNARVTVASDQPGGFSTATVSEGRAVIDQNRARRPTTTLSLSGPLACPRLATVAAAAVVRARKQRQIFVETKGGRFKTRGNRAAGTASGTAWRTTDTCTATTIKVTEGTVRVRDFRRRRTLNVTAPGSHTARR